MQRFVLEISNALSPLTWRAALARMLSVISLLSLTKENVGVRWGIGSCMACFKRERRSERVWSTPMIGLASTSFPSYFLPRHFIQASWNRFMGRLWLSKPHLVYVEWALSRLVRPSLAWQMGMFCFCLCLFCFVLSQFSRYNIADGYKTLAKKVRRKSVEEKRKPVAKLGLKLFASSLILFFTLLFRKEPSDIPPF